MVEHFKSYPILFMCKNSKMEYRQMYHSEKKVKKNCLKIREGESRKIDIQGNGRKILKNE